jgi:hypothetical protein
VKPRAINSSSTSTILNKNFKNHLVNGVIDASQLSREVYSQRHADSSLEYAALAKDSSVYWMNHSPLTNAPYDFTNDYCQQILEKPLKSQASRKHVLCHDGEGDSGSNSRVDNKNNTRSKKKSQSNASRVALSAKFEIRTASGNVNEKERDVKTSALNILAVTALVDANTMKSDSPNHDEFYHLYADFHPPTKIHRSSDSLACNTSMAFEYYR